MMAPKSEDSPQIVVDDLEFQKTPDVAQETSDGKADEDEEGSNRKWSQDDAQKDPEALNNAIRYKGFRGYLATIRGHLTFAEARGIQPVTVEERSDPNFSQCFWLWWSMNVTIACFSTGALGPVLYGMGMTECFFVIIFINLWSCGIPSYFSTFGPKLGLRQMCQARYSFGFFGSMFPAIINMTCFIGFCTLNAIVGGQTLSAVSATSSLPTSAGITIIAVISMCMAFCGYKVIHAFEKWSWLPVTISFLILAIVASLHGHMSHHPPSVTGSSTTGNILSFASIIAGFTISWSGCTADFNTYMRPDVQSWKVFIYTFLGLYLSVVLIQLLGAAVVLAAFSGRLPSWEDAYNSGGAGGLVGEILTGHDGVGGFGKFLLVLIAFGMISNNAPTVYAFSNNLQILAPFLLNVPRFVFAILATAIYLPLAIVAANNFETALTNFLDLIGYWFSIFAAINLVEHLIFRRANFASYDLSRWSSPSLLPPGFAAMFSSLCGIGIVIPSMDQVWWRGPIPKAITGEGVDVGGDIGFELGFGVTVVIYFGTRWVEKKVFRNKR